MYFYDFRSYYNILIATTNHRLFLYGSSKLIKSFPVAVGKRSTPTPKGNLMIVNKALNPGGPFGVRWLGLNAPKGDY